MRHLDGLDRCAPGAADAAAEIARAVGDARLSQIVVFFSADYDAEILASALETRFPGVPVAGCSMSGGIAPAGDIDRGLVAIAFPAERFRIVSTVIDAIDHLDVERTASAVRALRRTLDPLDPGRDVEAAAGHRFALSLIDGLTNAEETVVSAIAWALDGIPIVGGSAGDDLRFRDAVLLHGGKNSPPGGGTSPRRDRLLGGDLQERQFRAHPDQDSW